MNDRRARRGTALLDVAIALVLLGLSGVALLGILGQTARSMRSTRDTERELRSAAAELDRFVAYDRAAMLARVGVESTHGWTITTAQLPNDLFDVRVGRTPATPLLRTTFYRPDTTP